VTSDGGWGFAAHANANTLVPQRVTQLAHGVPLDVESVGPTRVVASMQLGNEQHTPCGVVHAGAYTTTIETMATLGASAAARERGQFAVGSTTTPTSSGRS
jgi:acyl-coenzyme A thioesterase PaaI-like protein